MLLKGQSMDIEDGTHTCRMKSGNVRLYTVYISEEGKYMYSKNADVTQFNILATLSNRNQ